MFTHPCLPHPAALSPRTAWSGFMDALWAFLHDLPGFGSHSFPTTHFSSAEDSRHIPYRGRSERSHRATWDTGRGKPKENCPVEELTARKHGIINLPSRYNAMFLFSLHVWMFLRGSITAPPRLLFLPSVLIDVIFHQPASPWCQCACMWVGVCVCGSRSCDHAL